MDTLSQLYLKGVQIDWEAFEKPYGRKKVALPNYAFQRQRYWLEWLKAAKKHRSLQANVHPLLGEQIPSPSEEKLFRNEIDVQLLPYLEDHQVFEQVEASYFNKSSSKFSASGQPSWPELIQLTFPLYKMQP